MKTRKLLALIAAVAVTFALAMPAFAAVIYDGTNDMKAELSGTCDYPAYEGATDAQGSGRLAAAGGPSYTWDDANGLLVHNRENGWDSVDVTLGGLADGTYTLEVVGTTSDGGYIVIEDADSPWSVLAEGESGSSVKFEFNVSGGMYNDQNRLRIKNETMGEYYIKTILLHGEDAAGGGDVPAADAGAAPNPTTGESTLIFTAGAILLAATCALIVIRRKAKAN